MATKWMPSVSKTPLLNRTITDTPYATLHHATEIINIRTADRNRLRREKLQPWIEQGLTAGSRIIIDVRGEKIETEVISVCSDGTLRLRNIPGAVSPTAILCVLPEK